MSSIFDWFSFPRTEDGEDTAWDFGKTIKSPKPITPTSSDDDEDHCSGGSGTIGPAKGKQSMVNFHFWFISTYLFVLLFNLS